MVLMPNRLAMPITWRRSAESMDGHEATSFHVTVHDISGEH